MSDFSRGLLAPVTWSPMKVRLDEVYGNDLVVVNAARRSFGAKSEWADAKTKTLTPEDQNLITFLGRGLSSKDFDEFVNNVIMVSETASPLLPGHGANATLLDIGEEARDALIHMLWEWRNEPIHDTPFNHVGASFSIRIPLFVARQLVKTEYMPWSEISRRYKEGDITFWRPGLEDGMKWREAPENKKQGSGHNLPEPEQEAFLGLIDQATQISTAFFELVLDNKVCMEQARMFLPANLMVEVTWTGFLGAICKMLRERTSSGAQKETQWVAQQMLEALKPNFPYSVASLVHQ